MSGTHSHTNPHKTYDFSHFIDETLNQIIVKKYWHLRGLLKEGREAFTHKDITYDTYLKAYHRKTS